MTADELLRRLDSVKPNGSGWMARCPAHADGTASLSIAERDGKLLVHCHAGCSAESIVEALGLSMADLYERPAVARLQRG